MVQAKPRLSAPEVERFLAPHFGWLTDIECIEEGEDSQALAFSANGDLYVLRINRNDRGFAKDSFAHRRWHNLLPIPEVMLIDTFGSLTCCVSRRMTGLTLQALPPPQSADYAGAICDLLDYLAGAPMSDMQGAGPFDGRGLAARTGWRDFLASTVRPSELTAAANAPELTALIAKFNRLLPACPEKRQLVHGDFGSNNVLVENGRVSGLIDWSEAMIGDSDYDLANLLFWRSWLDCMEQQCAYIEREQPHRLSNGAALACYQLHIGVRTLDEAAQDGDSRLWRWALARCVEISG